MMKSKFGPDYCFVSSRMHLYIVQITSPIATFSVAVMTKAYSEDADDATWLVLLENIASYLLLACGVVYVIAVG